MSEVEFDEAKHEYKVAGAIVPGVTRILGDLSAFKRLDPEMLAAASQRGKLVHRAVELYNNRDLDEASLHTDLEPYVRGWKRFCDDYQYEPIYNELRIHSERWNYCGTLDTMGTWKQLRRRPLVLIDVKTGIADPSHGPQLAAYVEPLRDMGMIPKGVYPQRAVVRLQPNGHYCVDSFLDPGDWSIFLAQLTTYRFKAQHGLL
jgi:hypothetical protein